ncbi:MAG TPA: alpha/beta hydrolase [Actinomycetes bacterium]
MATYVLIHGSGDSSWYWHLLSAELRERGHDVVAPDLPIEDDTAGLWQYADTVVEAIGDRRDLVVVAQSAGAFTDTLVCERVPVDLLVLLAGMVPLPGEPPEEWWANTGCAQARREQDERDGRAPDDMIALFMQDVPADLAATAFRRERHQSETPGRKPWPLAAWPNVPTRFLLCRDDRLFPADFMRRVVRERLGIAPDEIDGSHCVALSRPKELAERLESYRAEL